MLISLVASYTHLSQCVCSTLHTCFVADSHSSAARATTTIAAMGGPYQFVMSITHHPNGEYVPCISVG